MRKAGSGTRTFAGKGKRRERTRGRKSQRKRREMGTRKILVERMSALKLTRSGDNFYLLSILFAIYVFLSAIA